MNHETNIKAGEKIKCRQINLSINNTYSLIFAISNPYGGLFFSETKQYIILTMLDQHSNLPTIYRVHRHFFFFLYFPFYQKIHLHLYQNIDFFLIVIIEILIKQIMKQLSRVGFANNTSVQILASEREIRLKYFHLKPATDISSVTS